MADATPATNATNHTRYFNLPLFVSSDRPSWLVDWNGAMGEIDTILNDIATTSEGASSAVATIKTQIDTLSATVTSLNGIVDTAVADVASMQTTVDAVDTRLDSVEADLITQNNLIKTLSDTVVAMQATVSSLDNHVDTLNDAVTAMGVNVSAIQTALNGVTSDVSALQSSVSSINSRLSSLDSRVTALENAPAVGGMPFISDFSDSTKYTASYIGTLPESSITTNQVSQTFFTATEECYVGGNFGVTGTSGLDQGISSGSLEVFVGSISMGKAVSIPATSSTGSLSLQFLVRLKAGDRIVYTSKCDSDHVGFMNFYKYVAV